MFCLNTRLRVDDSTIDNDALWLNTLMFSSQMRSTSSGVFAERSNTTIALSISVIGVFMGYIVLPFPYS